MCHIKRKERERERDEAAGRGFSKSNRNRRRALSVLCEHCFFFVDVDADRQQIINVSLHA